MPGRSLSKEILWATGKVDGKAKQWIVAAFADAKSLASYAGMLKLAYATKNHDTTSTMDPHVPGGDVTKVDDVPKFTKQTVQYSPDVPGLDDETTLG